MRASSRSCPSCPTSGPKCNPLRAGQPPSRPAANAADARHRQFQSYGGWTFAFNDYTDLNLTTLVDDPRFQALAQVVDPAYYGDRLARLPKLVGLSSDDEFMQFDWSDIWYNTSLTGEKHLLIAPNSEHSLSTGFPEIIESASYLVHSIAAGKTSRPNFDYAYDASTGALTITVPPGVEHAGVVLRHAETISDSRRDFRWVRLASPSNGNCSLPEIKLAKPIFGGNCLVPIVWHSTKLTAVKPGVYRAVPPEPKKGHWTGYYIELYFPSDTGHQAKLKVTTPGYAWPNTLPFKDCTGAACAGHLL